MNLNKYKIKVRIVSGDVRSFEIIEQNKEKALLFVINSLSINGIDFDKITSIRCNNQNVPIFKK